MANKIGRNNPCPCGSGKKYKHCCLRLEEAAKDFSQKHHAVLPMASLNAPKLKRYFETHDSKEVLDYIIAFQLNPSNHGKNMRIERMAQLAIHALGKGNAPIDTKALKKLMNEEFPDDVMEDLPMNMYCENVLFFGGNYFFFPGLSTHATELFNVMTDTVYRNEDVFPESFRNKVYQGVIFLLEFGKAIALRAGITGMTRGNEGRRDLITEPTKIVPYGLPEEELFRVFAPKGVNEEIVDTFVVDNDDPHLLAEDIDENPLLYKPLVRYDGLIYFACVSSQGAAINNFILQQAKKHGCLDELVKRTQHTIRSRIGTYCANKMHWGQIPADNIIQTEPNFDEALFEIDTNWIAYVVYAKDSERDVSINGAKKHVRWDMDSHLKANLAALRKDNRTRDKHIFTLVLYSSMGEFFMLTMNEQPDSDYLLTFSAFEFLQLIQTEKWDSMSLVRYARTKESMTSFKYARNQNIDCYSLYKHTGECFYLSDKPRPDILQLEPNEGYALIKESKEKLNNHGALMHIEGNYAYIPVIRDMNYAEIYEPVDDTIIAKHCNSYHVPVWVKSEQEEKKGVNPSSFIETTLTAIAFWMEAMAPSLDELINAHYKMLVDIELELSEELLTDKDFQHEENIHCDKGELRVTKTPSGVSVFMDKNYIRTFMGANNTSEREMMKYIIVSLVGLEEDEAQRTIDEYIPLGQAKMILMMDPSQIPLTYPLWLYSPIYIHKATNQLLNDKLPQWMKEKGKDIDGTIEDKKEKVQFLHELVDVLLEKVTEYASVFNTFELIIRLLNNHETLMYLREHNKMLDPAQILCFGESEEKRKEIIEEELRLTDSGLATRALIEYLSATQDNKGLKHPGNDDIENMLALMSDIVHFGGICDAIHLGVSDHVITKLPSGRYGIYDDGFIDSVGGFVSARTMELVNNAIEGFASRMDHLSATDIEKTNGRDPVYDKMDQAFLSDWGVTFSNLLKVLYACYILAMKKRASVIDIEENDLVMNLCEIITEMTQETALRCLQRLSLDKRGDYLTPPEGFDVKDIFPWCYNREVSFLRRPFVRYQMTDGTIHCLFGFRSCLQAGVKLADLLYSGRLKYGGSKIEKMLGYFEDEKGKEFNEAVRTYLNTLPGLKVWTFDVTIKPKGNLVAERDYGDIDVMAYDTTTNILYSIECKNTNTAKNIREMKNEMDEYLGRGENPETDRKRALVLKHLRRHKWLVEHTSQLKTFVGINQAPIVKSMMLTSEVIPTSYLRKKDTPLSILNYGELRAGGLDYLNSSKEPNLNVL